MNSNIIEIETPLGILQFVAKSNGIELNASYLNVCKIVPHLPEKMSVESCYSVLFSYNNIPPLNEIEFLCKWKELQQKGDWNSGQGLAAWDWEKNNNLVSIGTEDEELFSTRTKTDSLENYSATLNENTIKIEVNEFNQYYPLSLHFVIAWNSLPEETESSCNFAVDVPHKIILKGCSKK